MTFVASLHLSHPKHYLPFNYIVLRAKNGFVRIIIVHSTDSVVYLFGCSLLFGHMIYCSCELIEYNGKRQFAGIFW